MHSLLISPAISLTRSFLMGLHLHIDLAICDNVPLQSIFPIEARPPSSDFCFVFEGHWTVIVTLVLPPSAVALQLLLGLDTAPEFSRTTTSVAFLACYFSLQVTPRLCKIHFLKSCRTHIYQGVQCFFQIPKLLFQIFVLLNHC